MGLGRQDAVQAEVRAAQGPGPKTWVSNSLQDGAVGSDGQAVTSASSGTFPCDEIVTATRYLLSVRVHSGLSVCLVEAVAGGRPHRGVKRDTRVLSFPSQRCRASKGRQLPGTLLSAQGHFQPIPRGVSS